jgi:hypothetical protein
MMNWADFATGAAASVLVLAFERSVSAWTRRGLAKEFTGTYRMFDGTSPCAGSVKIEYQLGLRDFVLGSTPALTVAAEHGESGVEPRTEDWTATVVLHSSDTASGFYRHRNREGGDFRLTRLEGGSIVEYGTPHDRAAKTFIRTLRRI